MLCARIIEYMGESLSSPVAYFFLSSKFSSRDDPYLVIRSWIAQLISDHPPSFEIARQMRQDQNDKHAARSTVIELLGAISPLLPGCTMVLDGLDECTWLLESSETTDSVTTFVQSISSALAHSKCRLLLVSRDEPEIRRATETELRWTHLKITPADVQLDVAAYSRDIVDRKLASRDEALRQELSQSMVDRCNGQFLWLKLQGDELRSWMNKKKLEDMIDNTPSGLDRLYERNMDKILEQPERERNRALRLLRWTAFALEPLSVEEIAEAVLIDHGLDDLPILELPDVVDQHYIATEITDLCGSLLEVREDDDGRLSEESTVHLTHFSVKQYLIRNSHVLRGLPRKNTSSLMTKADENTILARLCLRYIDYPHAWRGDLLGGLTPYAAGAWVSHVLHGCQRDIKSSELMGTLFDDSNPRWQRWKDFFPSFVGHGLPNVVHPERYTEKDKTPLYFAAKLGLEDLFEQLLKHKGPHSSATLSMAMTEAGAGGLTNIIRLVLDYSPDIESLFDGDWRAIGTAAWSGNLDTVKMLTERTVDIDFRSARGGSPLLFATEQGHLHVVRYLLERGQRGTDGYFDLPQSMHHAVIDANLPIVEALVEHGADIEARWDGMTPLEVAALFGHTHIVKYLCSQGARINEPSADGSLPVVSAASGGSVDTITALYDLGADVDGKTARGITALMAAAESGLLAVTVSLVEHGADTNASEKNGATSLYYAARGGHTKVIEYLLSKNADPLMSSVAGWMPIHEAAWRGHSSSLTLLMNADCPYDTKDNYGSTPLVLACSAGHLDCVTLLVEAGADVTIGGPDGWGTLVSAADCGSLAVAEYLIQNGAGIETTNNELRTPLIRAAERGHLEMVRFLLDQGASTTAVDRDGWTASLWAAQNANLDVLKILMKYSNTDAVNFKDPLKRNALHLAVRKDPPENSALAPQAPAGDILSGTRILSPPEAPLKSRTKRKLIPPTPGESKSHQTLRLQQRLEVVEFLLDVGCDATAIDEYHQTPAAIAAIHGFLNIFKALVPTKATYDLTVCEEQVLHPFSQAAAFGHISIASYLLDLGVDALAVNAAGYSPLACAAMEGQLEIVKLLVDAWPDTLNQIIYNGFTPLHVAVGYEQEKTVRFLIEAGADINIICSSYRYNAHFLAAQCGHVGILQILEESGADPGIAISTGDTSLHQAAIHGHVEIARHLLGRDDPDVNRTNLGGETALFKAAKHGQVDYARLLIAAGADSNMGDDGSKNPLEIAAYFGHLEFVRMLLQNVNEDTDIKQLASSGILTAAAKGHREVVALLFENGASLGPDTSDLTPLMVASIYGRLSVIEALINFGAEVNKAREDGITALHYAARNGHRPALELLLEMGADHTSTKDRELLLTEAVCSGDKDILDFIVKLTAADFPLPLIYYDTAPLGDSDGETRRHPSIVTLFDEDDEPATRSRIGYVALHLAAFHGHESLCTYLLAQGVDVSPRSWSGSTPVAAAASQGHPEVLKLLIKSGASAAVTDGRNQTLLHRAAEGGHHQTMELLFDYGAEVTAVDEEGKTPLHLAAGSGNVQAVQILLDHKADVTATCGEGETPLYDAVWEGHIDVCTLLLEYGSDPTAVDSSANRPLSVATSELHDSCIEILLDYGADIEGLNSDGETPLGDAVNRDSETTMKLLLDRGANPNCRYGLYRTTPLHEAAIRGGPAVVNLLLTRGADVTRKDRNGCTPLFLAAKSGNVEVVKMLLEMDTDATVADLGGLTPLQVAYSQGHSAVVKLLLQKSKTRSEDRDRLSEMMGRPRAAHIVQRWGGIASVLDGVYRTASSLGALSSLI